MTKACAEEVVERDLRRAGYRVYLPRYRKLLRPHGHNRKPMTAMRPLFASIVFVQDWRGWPSAPISGVIGLMSGLRGPRSIASLCDADIAEIQRRERMLDYDDVKHPQGGGTIIREDIKAGDTVSLDAHGVRIDGLLEALSEDGRAIVEAMVFGRATRLNVDAQQLVAARA